MAETALTSPSEAVPGTPGIREIRSESESLQFGPGPGRVQGAGHDPSPCPGIRKVNLRAEIDTSPPFGSVKEAVTRFGGHGPWIPLYKLGDNGNEEFDIKKVEEQAAELEKDLIVKELETLDVLEELTTTKRIVEELKRQLQKEALKCLTVPQDFNSDEHMPTPHIKEMNTNNNKNSRNVVNNHDHHRRHQHHDHHHMMGNSSPCPTSSPDMILMELKRAKLNLGKTINDLGVIQNSVETLNKKMKKEKELIEKTRERLTSKFAGVLSLEEELENIRVKPNMAVVLDDNANRGFENSNFDSSRQVVDQCDVKSEVSRAIPSNEQSMKTAEMKWVAAKKMGEAAKAAEAVALAELKALTNGENPSDFLISEPQKMSFNFKVESPLNFKAAQEAGAAGWSKKKLADAMIQIDEAHTSKLAILRKLKEATEEIKFSKQALEEALNRVEVANRKQLAAEEAFHRWIPEHDRKRNVPTFNPVSPRINIFHPPNHHMGSPLNHGQNEVLVENCSKPVLKPTVSMRDVLSRKQVMAEDYVGRKEQSGHGHGGEQHQTHKVALSEMLQALREDLRFSPKTDHHKERSDHKQQPQQYLSQRKKFGFIQISLPLTKPSKKKMQILNAM